MQYLTCKKLRYIRYINEEYDFTIMNSSFSIVNQYKYDVDKIVIDDNVEAFIAIYRDGHININKPCKYGSVKIFMYLEEYIQPKAMSHFCREASLHGQAELCLYICNKYKCDIPFDYIDNVEILKYKLTIESIETKYFMRYINENKIELVKYLANFIPKNKMDLHFHDKIKVSLEMCKFLYDHYRDLYGFENSIINNNRDVFHYCLSINQSVSNKHIQMTVDQNNVYMLDILRKSNPYYRIDSSNVRNDNMVEYLLTLGIKFDGNIIERLTHARCFNCIELLVSKGYRCSKIAMTNIALRDSELFKKLSFPYCRDTVDRVARRGNIESLKYLYDKGERCMFLKRNIYPKKVQVFLESRGEIFD